MNDTYQKCILLFSGDDSRILIISNENNDKKEFLCQSGSRIIDFVSLQTKFEYKTQDHPLAACDHKKEDYHNGKLYDLIILDQVCDSPVLHNDRTSIWKNRQEMFRSLSKRIKPNGSLIIFTHNAINLQKAAYLFNALINLFVQTRSTGTFLGQFTKELKKFGFSQFNYYYLYPSFNVLSDLISTEHHAFQTVISRKYGMPLDSYRHPRFWLRWIFVRAQLDRWLLCCQLIWVKK